MRSLTFSLAVTVTTALVLASCSAPTTPQTAATLSPATIAQFAPHCPGVQPYADAAPLGSDAPFTWNCWSGDTELDEEYAESWDLQTFLETFYDESNEWTAFVTALNRAFPGGVTVYRSEEACQNCHQWNYVIKGVAPWGVGGFTGKTFWDY